MVRNIIIAILLGVILLLAAPSAFAEWQRFKKVADELYVTNNANIIHMVVMYDTVEKVNCYVTNGSHGDAIFCMKASK